MKFNLGTSMPVRRKPPATVGSPFLVRRVGPESNAYRCPLRFILWLTASGVEQPHERPMLRAGDSLVMADMVLRQLIQSRRLPKVEQSDSLQPKRSLSWNPLNVGSRGTKAG